MHKGIVFNIQKFSIHDGPGVRTTVFLKGCPLKCRWCANPESQAGTVQVLYDHGKCLGCGHCISVCRKQAVEMRDGRICIQTHRCTGCLECVRGCPARALAYEGEYKSVDQVVEICLQDKDFYEESGGGVTVSGGEGMTQPGFLKELVYELKRRGIHVAIETTGCVEKELFRELAVLFDLLLFDVKHYDRKKHKEGTGASNDRIVENLRWAALQELDVLPRIPVIPGFNDSPKDAEGISKLLKDVGLKRVQLLPFHQMGERKYEMLNKDYGLKGVKPLHTEELEEYRAVFAKDGIEAFF